MIYLDYNATTPIAGEVAKAMLPYLYDHFGNPSSNHILGAAAKEAVETARLQVANLLNTTPGEIVFTSGGSEANNAVLKGVADTYQNEGKHIITSEIEHPAIINPCKYLEKKGFTVSYVSVDAYGMVDPKEIESLITEETILVTIMHSNNETGTIQPIEEIAEICKKHNCLFHTDASQSVGKVPVDVKRLGVDFLTVAGHKLYGPKGIGALFIREGIRIEPLIHGAGHEQGRRAGTENIILAAGLGKACEVSLKWIENDHVKEVTDYFFKELKKNFDQQAVLNGHPEKRLPNTVNVSFIGFNGYDILDKMDQIAASTGSACHSGMTTISPVLKAMGVSEEVGRGAIRFSLGRNTTKKEVDEVVKQLRRVIRNT
jgi:cysteine desulfurase